MHGVVPSLFLLQTQWFSEDTEYLMTFETPFAKSAILDMLLKVYC